MNTTTHSTLTAGDAADIFDGAVAAFGSDGARILAEALNAGFGLDAKLEMLRQATAASRANIDGQVAGVRDTLSKICTPAEERAAAALPTQRAPKAKGKRNV